MGTAVNIVSTICLKKGTIQEETFNFYYSHSLTVSDLIQNRLYNAHLWVWSS